MSFIKKWNLQLFADGGDGSAAGVGATGAESPAAENNADLAEQRIQHLKDMGVPEDKLEKHKGRIKQSVGKAQPDQPSKESETVLPEADGNKTTKPSWDEIKKDPDYNKEIQKIVSERTKKSKVAEDNLGKLLPAIEVLSRRYGMDINNLNYDDLAKAVDGDTAFYEDDALDSGEPVETYMQNDRDQRSAARQKTIQDEMLHNHFQGLQEQGERMKEVFPNFDLDEELKNPQFFKLTAPGVGIDVNTAYRIVHDAEIRQAEAQAVAQRVSQQIANNRQANLSRPTENGAGRATSAQNIQSYANYTPAQREALKQKIREYAAAGKTLRPGEYIPV